jgi:hypothetical protein
MTISFFPGRDKEIEENWAIFAHLLQDGLYCEGVPAWLGLAFSPVMRNAN